VSHQITAVKTPTACQTWVRADVVQNRRATWHALQWVETEPVLGYASFCGRYYRPVMLQGGLTPPDPFCPKCQALLLQAPTEQLLLFPELEERRGAQ